MDEEYNPGSYVNKEYKYSKVFFPRPVNINEAEKIVGILSKQLPAKITYQITKNVERFPDGKSQDLEGRILEGKIFSNENETKFYEFTCTNTSIHSNELPKKLDTLWFLAHGVPEKDSERYHPLEQRKLWEDSRQIIEKYFKEN